MRIKQVNSDHSIPYFKQKERILCKKSRRSGERQDFTSTVFLKAGAAAAAGYGDFSLAPGNAELLSAVGAFEVAVVFVTAHGALQAVPLNDRSGQAHKLGVFLLTGGNIPGKKAKQGDENQRQGKPIQKLKMRQRKEQIEEKVKNNEKQVEGIVAIAAIHKAMDRVADHRRASLKDREGRRNRLPKNLK